MGGGGDGCDSDASGECVYEVDTPLVDVMVVSVQPVLLQALFRSRYLGFVGVLFSIPDSGH